MDRLRAVQEVLDNLDDDIVDLREELDAHEEDFIIKEFQDESGLTLKITKHHVQIMVDRPTNDVMGAVERSGRNFLVLA